MKSVHTRFVAPQNSSVDTLLVVKVIISCDNFIAIDPVKKKLGHDLVFLIFTDNLSDSLNDFLMRSDS